MNNEQEIFFRMLTHQRISLLRHLTEKLDHENSTCADNPPHNLALIAVILQLAEEIKWNANERLNTICNEETKKNERRTENSCR